MWVSLDRRGGCAYIAAHDDDCCSAEISPPPCHPGTGALLHLIVAPRAAGFRPRHFL